MLKGLGDRLRADPGSLCNVSSQCVDLVKKGHAVYTGVEFYFIFSRFGIMFYLLLFAHN